MQSGRERAGAGSEAEAKIGVTMKAEAEVAVGANQAAGEAQRASGQLEQREAPAAVSRGGAHSGSAFPPATALGVRG